MQSLYTALGERKRFLYPIPYFLFFFSVLEIVTFACYDNSVVTGGVFFALNRCICMLYAARKERVTMTQTEYVLPVSEKNYTEGMEKAEKYLSERGTDGCFISFDGKSIHYEKYMCDNAKASIVIVHGFTECAEKFREVSFNFLLGGYNVFAVDNRGHGYSARLTDDRETVCVGKFTDYVEDLQCFVEKIVRPASGELPLYVYCHSMGGAITVQHLQTYPGVFKKAVLSAPMIQAQTMGLPEWLANAAARLGVLFGQGNKRIPGAKGFNPHRTYQESHDTSKARFDYWQKKRCEDFHFQTADPSFNWVKEAVAVSRRNLDPERNARIKIPVFLCQPEEDSSVVSEKENEFIAMIKNGRLKKYTNCRHEIYMSVDPTVEEYYEDIKNFFEEK